MSSFRVNVEDRDEDFVTRESFREPAIAEIANPPRRGRRRLLIFCIGLLAVLLISFTVGYLYYQSLKRTPQYSLALLVDAAKRDDQPAIDQLIDINAVVDDFIPQITGKAVELYGKGLPLQVLARIAKIAAPLMPAVKERARAQLPKVIRTRTERFGNVPFFVMVLGADRYLDFSVNGDTAIVKSKLQDHPLEVKMRRNGDRWQITGVHDEQLATDIARKIGQELIAIAANGNVSNAAKKYGVGNLADLLRQAEEIVK
jgi:hypothetical protein